MQKKILKESAILLAVIGFVLSISFYDVIFLGKTFKVTTGNPQALTTGPYGQENNKPAYFPVQSTDVPIFEEGIMAFIKTSLWHGILPLWNPHQACGYPLIGAIHTGILWPLNYILYLIPDKYSWDILIFVRFILSGFLTYWFMRTMRFKPVPSLGASLAFMISAPMIYIHWSVVHVDILTPLLLIVMERLIQNPSLRRSCFVALVVACTCFAGNPEHVFLVNTYGILFFCFRFLSLKNKSSKYRVFIFLPVAYVFAGCLSAVVLFPFLQNWCTEFWHSHSKFVGAVAEGAFIRQKTLINFIMPHFFQKEPVTLGFERSTFWGHIGIFPLWLAFLGLLTRQRRGLNYFLATMVVLIFTKSYINFPVTNWLGMLPVFRDCRFVHHTQHLFIFSISVLAGMGIWQVLRRTSSLVAALIFCAIIIPFAGFSLYSYRYAPHFSLSLKAFLFALGALTLFACVLALKDKKILKANMAAGLLIGALVLELFLYIPRGGRVNRFDSFPTVPYLEFLQKRDQENSFERSRMYGVYWTFYPNTASGYQVDDLGIVDGLLPKRYVDFVNHLISPKYFDKSTTRSAFWVQPFTLLPNLRPYFDMLNIRYTIAPPWLAETFPPARDPNYLKLIYSHEANVYEHEASQRAFVVQKVLFEPDPEKVFEKMERIKGALSYVAIIQHTPIPDIIEKMQNNPMVPSTSNADIVKYTPNEVIIDAHMKKAGVLVLSDTYHPDWKAYVNGKQQEIYFTNALVRSVFLDAGEHRVYFRFQPKSFYVGLIVTLFSFISLLTIMILTKTSTRICRS